MVTVMQLFFTVFTILLLQLTGIIPTETLEWPKIKVSRTAVLLERRERKEEGGIVEGEDEGEEEDNAHNTDLIDTCT